MDVRRYKREDFSVQVFEGMKVNRELDKYFQVGPKRRVYSSLAQSVEHAAVNRSCRGSSPTGGA